MAAELAASGRPGAESAPDPAFVEQMRRRMREADAGIDAVRQPPPVREQPLAEGSARWRLTRRQVLQAGFGAAAGMAAGVIGASLIGQASDARSGATGPSSPARASGPRSPGRTRFKPETPSDSAPGVRRLRRQRRWNDPRALVGLHPHGLHPRLPAGLAGPSLSVPRGELRAGRAPGQRKARLARGGRPAATRMPTRSSCPTSCVPRSRWPMARSWSGPRRPRRRNLEEKPDHAGDRQDHEHDRDDDPGVEEERQVRRPGALGRRREPFRQARWASWPLVLVLVRRRQVGELHVRARHG